MILGGASDVVCGGLPPDRIFASDFTLALIIAGKAGYPGPLANADVEIHFGQYVNVARSASDGTFRAGIELDQLDRSAIVELVARGSGAQSHIVWASPLGPAGRLIDMAGSGGTVTAAEDPFVNLNPRTTAAAAAIRAYNGYQAVLDPAVFHRAARSRQYASDDLAYALAMVARGTLSLPAGAGNTLDAVTSLESAQRLYADEQAAYADCGSAPTSPYCEVVSTMPIDPAVVPRKDWSNGTLYTAVVPYGNATTSLYGFRPTSGDVEVVVVASITGAGSLKHATASPDADGNYRLAPIGGLPFDEFDAYPVIGGGQVREHRALTALRVRPASGPGGQSELAYAAEWHITYPENPEIPSLDRFDSMSLPGPAFGGPLAEELLAEVPAVANRTFVMPTSTQSSDALDHFSRAYDIYHFGSSSGSIERTGQSFSFGQSLDRTTITIDRTGAHEEIEFFNEEEPGVWRVRTHGTGGVGDVLADGLAIEVQTGVAWTAANVPGTYRAEINGHLCSGPYGSIDAQTDFPFCTPPYAWTFNVGGAASNNASSTPWTWSVGAGTNAGRLLLDRPDGYQRRGWQRMSRLGGTDWVLENISASSDGDPAPPVAFTLTNRLIRVVSQ
jgi:hypothetical protein